MAAAGEPETKEKTGWFRGIVKGVPSGDALLIMACSEAELPKQKTITLSSIIAPRLARRGGRDEPFAWESREFLRKLSIGEEVTFSSDYKLTTTASGREFGRVFIGADNVAELVVAAGYARVKGERGCSNDEKARIAALRSLERTAEDKGLGLWSKEPDAAKEAVRDLPPISAMGGASGFDARGFVDENKGKSMKAIVEDVRDGSTIRVHLLPSSLFAQIYVAGVKAPSMGRRPIVGPNEAAQSKAIGEDVMNKDDGIPPDRFGEEAKHFTEKRILSREVTVVVEGTDNFQNLFGSVYYLDGETTKDLALDLVENGFAKLIEWSAKMLHVQARKNLKNAELQAKKDQLRIWTGFKPPATNTKQIHDQKFAGEVIEVVNSCCIIVADDAVPYGSPAAERRVYLSSIRPPKLKNPSPFAHAAKEFLRTRLIGKQVHVSMEFAQRINVADGTRVLHYGSVFLPLEAEAEGADAPPVAGVAVDDSGDVHGQRRVNVAEMLLSRGMVDVTRHRDYEERSRHYDDLLLAHARAQKAKKGYHSATKDYRMAHITDLSMVPAKKAREFLHLLQGGNKCFAIVEQIFSGHRFKVTIPKETCTIVFSFSRVRCPGRNEAYSDEAMALMRRRILQREVEIDIETVDRFGTFLGSLCHSQTNMACVLLEAGLAKTTSHERDSIPDCHALSRAEKSAKQNKLKVWENYEGVKIDCNDSTSETKQKETPKVVVTEVLGEGKCLASLQVIDPLETPKAEDHPLESSSNKGPPKSQNVSSYLSALVNGKRNKDTLDDGDHQPETSGGQDPSRTLDDGDHPSNQSSECQIPSEPLQAENPLETLEAAAPLPSSDTSLKVDATSDVAPPFNHTKGDVVLAQLTLDNSWNRAKIMGNDVTDKGILIGSMFVDLDERAHV